MVSPSTLAEISGRPSSPSPEARYRSSRQRNWSEWNSDGDGHHSRQEFGAVAFASDGTLWYTPEVVSARAVDLFRFSAGSAGDVRFAGRAYMLQANGPSVLSGQAAIFTSTNEIAFDGNGNLWSVFNGFYFEYAQNILHASPSAPTTGFQAYPSEQQGGNTEILPGYALAFDPRTISSPIQPTTRVPRQTCSRSIRRYNMPGRRRLRPPRGSGRASRLSTGHISGITSSEAVCALKPRATPLRRHDEMNVDVEGI